MIMFGVGTFVGLQLGMQIMVVLGDASGEFGFFIGIVNNLVSVTNPATLWLIGSIGV